MSTSPYATDKLGAITSEMAGGIFTSYLSSAPGDPTAPFSISPLLKQDPNFKPGAPKLTGPALAGPARQCMPRQHTACHVITMHAMSSATL